MNKTVALDGARGALAIIDQTLLPGREELIYLSGVEEIRDAIRELKVRGAPAIGAAAAIGIYLKADELARAHLGSGSVPPDYTAFYAGFRAAKERLNSARPTAVNLSWALNRMEKAALECGGAHAAAHITAHVGKPVAASVAAQAGIPVAASAVSGPADMDSDAAVVPAAAHAAANAAAHAAAHASGVSAAGVSAAAAMVARLKAECLAILEEDERVCAEIGRHGLTLLRPGMGLLTHCNAGRLATVSKYGTATAPIYLGHEQGYNFKVYCDETRPLLQGARLTAYELTAAGVDTTLQCDNMAPSLMSAGVIDAVLVGCDRVAANGDAANKIGTSYVAIAAKHYGIPFYVCAPSSTVDLDCANGGSIVIEQRGAEEVTEMWYARRAAPDGVKVFNPSFDVTGADLITAIITEFGVIRAPYRENLAAAIRRNKK